MKAALARAAFMHHDDPAGLIHSQRIGMMYQCSMLLAVTAKVHHDDKILHLIFSYNYAVIKGTVVQLILR